MDKWEKEQIVDKLSDLLEFYGKPINGLVIQAWIGTVADAGLSLEEFSNACVSCLRQNKFMPSIDEFMDIIRGDIKVLEAASNANAWSLVLEASAISTSQTPEHHRRRYEIIQQLTSAQERALKSVGGFYSLGQLSPRDLQFRQRDFIQHCETYQKGDEVRKMIASQKNQADDDQNCLEEADMTNEDMQQDCDDRDTDGDLEAVKTIFNSLMFNYPLDGK